MGGRDATALFPRHKMRGCLSAQWAFLEIELDLFISLLLTHPGAKHMNTKIPLSFSRRMALLRSCARAILNDQPELRDKLIAIADDASSLRGRRDEIIHGRWHLHRSKDGGQLGTAVTVFGQLPNFHVALKPLPVEQVEEIAAKISAVTWRLTWFHDMHVSYQPPP